MERSIYTTVVALEITSRHSRYAFSFKHEFETDPLKIHVNRGWNSGNRHCISLKIPTCILLDNNKDIIDFGYEAFNKYQEICFDEDRACYYFFDRPFKVVENNMYQDLILTDEGGRNLPASYIWKKIFQTLVILVMEEINSRDSKITTDQIKWVICVSAYWSDSGKTLLRSSAEKSGLSSKQLMLVTEHDAAFFYHQNILERDDFPKLKDGTECMIVDIREYNVRITIVQKETDHIIIKCQLSDDEYGNQSANRMFFELLCEIFGSSMDYYYKIKYPEDYVVFEEEFEKNKRRITTKTTTPIYVRFPISLNAFIMEREGQTLSWLLENSRYKGEIVIFRDKLRFQPDTFRDRFFRPSINKVVCLIKQVFDQKEHRNNAFDIVMVGAFSSCSVVQDDMRQNFPTRRINISEEAELAIVKGSVLCGYQLHQATSSPSELLHTYEKLPAQKGFMLVINYKFPGPKERKASQDDVLKLCDFFYKLDYDIDCRSDMTTKELKICLENVKYNYLTRDSPKYHCFICVIMSHGNEKGLSTTDGTVKVDELIRPFKNDNASSFIGKPKIFLVLACRGSQSQIKQTYVEPNHNVETDSTEDVRMPTDADIITVYATTPGYKSYRTVKSTKWTGTWFIQAFLTVSRNHPHNHLLEILTAVNYELANNPEYEFDGEKCQLSMSETSLSKLFYF